MTNFLKNSKGFTLVEIIVSLVLVGILASMAGFGLVQATRGFLFVKDNTEKAQTGQLVMNRLSKAITNWTYNDNIATGWLSNNSIVLERKHNDAIIIENYSYNNGDNTVTVARNEANTNPKILSENIESLSFSFQHTNNPSGWSAGTHPIADLASVTIDMTIGGDNSSSTAFQTRVVPRNTYNPSHAYLNPGSGSASVPSCFIATASYGGDDNPSVELLKEFRDNFLIKVPGGNAFIKYYYKFGPHFADLLRNSEGGKEITRFFLSPLVGMIFILIYFPEGLLFLAAITWILIRMFKNNKKLAFVKLNNENGSAIVMAIAAILLFSAIGAGIVSMTSSSMFTQVGYNNSNQAYLLAEGGFRYAAYEYNEDMQDSTLVTLHTNAAIAMNGASNKSFDLEIEPYWFNLNSNNSAVVNSDCAFPTLFTTNVSGASTIGYLKVGTAPTLYPYTGYTYNGPTLTFNGTGAITGTAGTEVFLATRTSGGQALTEGSNSEIDLETGASEAFPLFNGIVEIITNTSGSNETYFVWYDKKVGNKLIGLKKVYGEKTLPFSVNNADPIVLTKFADVKSTGIVGAGTNPVTRTITYSQPLFEITIYKRREWSTGFDNPSDVTSNFNAILGSHGHAVIEGDGAFTITGTSEEHYYDGWGNLFQHRFEESVIGLEHTATSLGLYDAWSESEHTLSYDLQVKIRFSSQDDLEENYLGTYMPGISFRLNSNADRYYGLSIMRGLPGVNWHFGWAEVIDDIPDTLFDDHNSDSQTPPHNDIKPIPGMPYLVLWQKSDKNFWESVFAGDSIEEYEWLSYLALCDIEVVNNVYYYPPGSNPVPGSCGGWWCNFWDCCDDINNIPWGCNSCWNWSTSPARGIFIGNGTYPLDKTGQTGPYTMYKLTPKSAYNGVLNFETVQIDGTDRTFLGEPGLFPVKDSSSNIPVENVGFILPEGSPFGDPGSFNYRIYPKNWTTIMTRILEFERDVDGDGTDEKMNAIQAWIAGTDDVARGTIQWPEDGNYLSHITWDDYTSQEFSRNILGYPLTTNALLAKIGDVPEIVYSAFLTTLDYPTDRSSWANIPEVGIHTLGIDVRESTETVYFDDFAMALYEGNSGLYSPVQSE